MKPENKCLYLGDCLDILQNWYSNGYKEFIDLICIDPPFNSNRNYNIILTPDTTTTEEAFKDTWSNVAYLDQLDLLSKISPLLYNFLQLLDKTSISKSIIAYLTIMGIRCWYIREMLKQTGSFYYHCDPTMSHYIKILLDIIFGRENFRNEIIWKRSTNSGAMKYVSDSFGKNHDVILFYTKSSTYIYNQQFIPFTEEYIKKNFRFDDFDGKGPYQWAPLVRPSTEKIEKLKQENKFWEAGDGNKSKYHGYKVYLSDRKGTAIGSIWDDIQPITATSKERLGYPTQKPVKLFERIISTSSNPNDLVVDFFMGGGTTIEAAEKLNRTWIGIDINTRAIQETRERIEKLRLKLKENFFIYGIPKSSKELRSFVEQNIFGKDKNSKFSFEDVIIKYYLNDVRGNEKKVGDHSIDGRFIFDYDNKKRMGLVQVTVSGNLSHLKSSCAELGKGSGELLIYITFEDKVNDNLRREAKTYGKIGGVDKVQILTVEDLIDKGKYFDIPRDIQLI